MKAYKETPQAVETNSCMVQLNRANSTHFIEENCLPKIEKYLAGGFLPYKSFLLLYRPIPYDCTNMFVWLYVPVWLYRPLLLLLARWILPGCWIGLLLNALTLLLGWVSSLFDQTIFEWKMNVSLPSTLTSLYTWVENLIYQNPNLMVRSTNCWCFV